MPSDRPSTIDRTNSGLSSPEITVHRTVIIIIDLFVQYNTMKNNKRQYNDVICEIYSLSRSNEKYCWKF